MILRNAPLFLLNLPQKSLLLLLYDLVLLQQLGLQVDLLLVDSVGGVSLLLEKSQLLIRIGSSDKRPGLLDDDEPS